MNTYLISDTHFGHKLMVDKQLRPFKSLTEMDEFMIYQWNKTVEADDLVYFLGDLSLGKNKTDIISKLNGHIIFIKGNHDASSLSNILSLEIKYEGTTLLLTHKPQHVDKFPHKFIIHGHIHENGKRDFIPVTGKTYANVNLEFHKYKPVLINELVGMIKNNKKAKWITRK